MARHLIWSTSALDDLDALAQFIARNSPQHARRVVQTMFELADDIGQTPLIGRTVPELGDPDIRERFVYSYRVIYELSDPDRLSILAILHGRRLLESIADRFGE